jgi:hypothetical protein
MITLSQRHCRDGTVTTALSRRHCHDGTVTTVLSRRHCHDGTVTTALSRQHCHNGTVTTALRRTDAVTDSTTKVKNKDHDNNEKMPKRHLTVVDSGGSLMAPRLSFQWTRIEHNFDLSKCQNAK